MLNKLCNGIETKNGKMLCAVLTTVGGLHLLMTAPQPVLGFLRSFSFNVMGREVGAQQLVGLGLTLCGVCCLVACTGSPVANMMDM